MVDFRFDIRPFFPQPIIKVTSNLLPHTFRGDRRQALDTTSKMSEIIDRLGQLSAVSQKLTKPVTTAQRLRMSDNQILYLLADVEAGHNGSVIGLLKVGTKDLYLFDEAGQTRKIENAPCILDFYIHESRQRAGLGKDIFETMLSEEHWTPLKCSVDRPSEKLLGFLKKHYGLVRTIPQANNFVLYEGFFDNGEDGKSSSSKQSNGGGMHITNSPNTQLFGAHYLGDDVNKKRMRQQDASAMGAQITQISPVGRYGARRPTCSMAEKTASDVSLTPSQAAEQAKLNARKNPLDALSRMSVRYQAVEKRSGLQDVDAEYLKNNVFSKSSFPKNSGLNENYGSKSQIPNQNAAGQPTPLSTDSTYKLQTGADSAGPPAQTPTQVQLLSQQQQQQQQQYQQSQQQQQQAQSNVLGQQQAQQHMQSHMQCKNQSFKESSHAQQQQQQQPPTVSGNEPEMCTTCPNCQTTIYLVRPNEGSHLEQQQQPPAGHHGNHEQHAIIHSNSTPNKGGAESSSALNTMMANNDVVESIVEDFQNLRAAEIDEEARVQSALFAAAAAEAAAAAADADAEEAEAANMPAELTSTSSIVEALAAKEEQHIASSSNRAPPSVSGTESFLIGKKPSSFQLSKQHTGMKNISFGVGMAVTPTAKMEFDQESNEEFGVVKINRPVGKLASPPPALQDNSDAQSTVSEGLTDQGYYDLKFYHNKLW